MVLLPALQLEGPTFSTRYQKQKPYRAVPGLRKCGLLPLRSPKVCTISFQPLTPPSLGMEPKGSLALSYIPTLFILR